MAAEPAEGAPNGESPLQRAVKEAWAAAAQLPEEVSQATREAAFKLVLEAMLRNGQDGTTHPGAAAQGAGPVDAFEAAFATVDQRAYAIADYLNVGYEDALALYSLDEVDPVLQVSKSRLSNSCAEATREVALLVAAARAALGLDTEPEHVREAAEHLNVLDAANFGPTLAQFDAVALLRPTSNTNRLVRLRGRGLEQVRFLAARIVGA